MLPSTDQILFEAIVTQIYLYYFLSPNIFSESMLQITKELLKILRWKILRGLAIIEPVNILAPKALFH